MKRVLVILGVCFSAMPNAFAAENERGVSVYDANPNCMERTTPSNAPECVLREEGAPRQYYPPPTVTPVIPNPPVMPPSPPVVREGGNNIARSRG